ncbi:MAG TPA: hypothetical protein VFE37_19850 [Chloroflexota bacterium]|nr:hypothetical protein [Chloroflexota bacterium]
MRPRIGSRLASAFLVFTSLALATGLPPHPASGQAALAPEPTYRYAGHYEGPWTAQVSLDEADSGTVGPALFDQRAGALQGTITLDVGCDGSVSGQAHGQTSQPAALAALADGPAGPRVLTAALDLVADGAVSGTLSSRSAAGDLTSLQAALAGALRDLPAELETVAAPESVERAYLGAGTLRLEIQDGAPGRLAGRAAASLRLSTPTVGDQPPAGVTLSGPWVASRTAVALCPWQGSVTVSGAIAIQQLHDERLDVTFHVTPDGRIEGDGRGVAALRGGPPGGCVYSGGGPFAVLVDGEAHDGRFYLHLEDFDQPQLVLTTSCATGRFDAPQTPLSTRFGRIELPEEVGAHAQLTLPPTLPDTRGMLDITITPIDGAAPP